MKGPRYATDGALRRRIHLFRHGDVSYVTPQGQRVPDPRVVPLTDWGHEQAKEMGEFLSHIHFDHAACSGLLRTVQTSSGILAGRDMEPEHIGDMEEVRGGGDRSKPPATIEEAAYAFHGAGEPGARYRDGELFADFEARVLGGLDQLLTNRTGIPLPLCSTAVPTASSSVGRSDRASRALATLNKTPVASTSSTSTLILKQEISSASSCAVSTSLPMTRPDRMTISQRSKPAWRNIRRCWKSDGGVFPFSLREKVNQQKSPH